MQRDTWNETSGGDAAFERRLDRALGRAPEPEIPVDFAARVAAMVPSRPGMVRRDALLVRPRFAFARLAVMVCGVAILLALLLLAPHTAGSRFRTAMEWVLCAQISLLAMSPTLLRDGWPLG